ncbi:MAG TPA: helix-turn-helix domain-containing protein [Jatrophihabitantaceae bacterium]|nr:helix-turn-helix domain-containing protein [Jatrophihabitantaceae bacterium]
MTPRRRTSPKRRPPVVLTEAADIKALTHPARLAVIDEFFGGRELTATECAEIAQVSPSAMSYHLRALEKVGIIERSDASGDGRQRPWRAAGSELVVKPSSAVAATAASAVLVGTALEAIRREVDAWVARDRDEPEDWRDVAMLASGRLWLTADELSAMIATIKEQGDQYRDRTASNRPEGSRRVRLGVQLFPVD